MLTAAQKQRIVDRFQMDAEALLDPQALQTPAGLRADIGNLWSQILDARKRYVSIRLKDCVANAAITTYLMAVGRTETLTAARIGFGVIPSSALGTIVLELAHRTGAGAAVEMQAGVSTDLETLVTAADTSYDIPLAAVANRRLVAGEAVYVVITSNNGDMAGGTDGILTLEFEPTEA